MKKSIIGCFFALASLLATNLYAQVAILDEKFDNGIPSSYILVNKDGYTPHADVSEYTNAWIITVDPADSTNKVASSTSYFDQPGVANRWMIIPSLQLGAYGNNLSWTGKSHDASYADGYFVLVSTTDTEIESFTDTLLTVPFEDVQWTKHTINLSDKGYDNQTIHLAFVLRSLDGYKYYMDSLSVEKDNPLNVSTLSNNTTIQLYPNPTTSHLTISNTVDFIQVVIRDVNGNELIQSDSSTVEVQHLSNGVYFAEVRTKNGVVVRKFLKQ
jgi:hypothetical protein